MRPGTAHTQAPASTLTIFKAAYIALDKMEPRPLLVTHWALLLIQISRVACRQVVQTAHMLIQQEKALKQVGANEAGNAGDQTF